MGEDDHAMFESEDEGPPAKTAKCFGVRLAPCGRGRVAAAVDAEAGSGGPGSPKRSKRRSADAAGRPGGRAAPGPSPGPSSPGGSGAAEAAGAQPQPQPQPVTEAAGALAGRGPEMLGSMVRLLVTRAALLSPENVSVGGQASLTCDMPRSPLRRTFTYGNQTARTQPTERMRGPQRVSPHSALEWIGGRQGPRTQGAVGEAPPSPRLVWSSLTETGVPPPEAGPTRRGPLYAGQRSRASEPGRRSATPRTPRVDSPPPRNGSLGAAKARAGGSTSQTGASATGGGTLRLGRREAIRTSRRRAPRGALAPAPSHTRRRTLRATRIFQRKAAPRPFGDRRLLPRSDGTKRSSVKSGVEAGDDGTSRVVASTHSGAAGKARAQQSGAAAQEEAAAAQQRRRRQRLQRISSSKGRNHRGRGGDGFGPRHSVHEQVRSSSSKKQRS